MSEAESGAEVEAPKAEPEPLKQIDLKAGDYKIHIFVQQGRALLPPKGGETTDPILSIRAFDQVKSSQPLQDIGSSSTVYWGEHFFFQKQNAIHQDLQDDKITIQVLDHNTLFKDSLVGVYELDLIYVYTQPNHAIVHTWVVLSNPQDENFDQMRGYLKIGVSVLHHQDTAVDLAVKEKVTSKDKDLLLPPHVKPKVVQLVVHCLKAENLPVMDKGESLDAYAVAKFAGAECRTSTYEADKATLSAYWYQQILIPVMLPCVTKTFTLMIWDHDTLSSDDLVGSFNLNFNMIKKGKYQDYFWANIYGAQALLDNDEAQNMNSIPETASCWRGRVLLRAWVIDTDDTVFKKVQKIKDENIESLIRDNFQVGPEYEIRAIAYSGTALPFPKGKYQLEVSWSGTNMITQIASTSNGNIDWYQNLNRKVLMIPNVAQKALPDVFVYLVYKEKRVCYARLKPQDLMNPNAQGTWISLMPDRAVGQVKDEWNSGFVKVRISISLYDQDNDDYNESDWKGQVVKPPMEKYVLLNHIFQCAQLPSSDSNGLADPYIKIYFGGNQISTKEHYKECTLNPKWYQTFPLNIEVPNVEDAPPIIIYLYDFDAISQNDIMGIVVITLQQASTSTQVAPKPKWYDLGLGKSISEGKILASFTLARPGQVPRFDITPQFVDKTVQINVLGLRDLKPSVGWLPVNKAFVKIDLNSLDLPDSSQGVSMVQTQPFQSGNNPNINTCLSFRCKIPKDPIFAPTLTCQVCDYLFAGLSQPLIGTFSVNLGDFMRGEKKNLFIPREGLFAGIPAIGKAKKSPLDDDFLSLSDPKKEQLKKQQENTDRTNALIEVDQAVRENLIKIFPTFQKQDGKLKEINIPNPEQYLALGWNRFPNDNLKHYRFYIKTQYGKSSLATNRPFDVFKLIKGQSRGLSSGESSIKATGKLKAKIRVQDFPPPKRGTKQFMKNALSQIASGDQQFDEISRALLCKIKCVVRVYIIDAFDLQQKDRQSHSDPYLRIKLGKQVQDFQDQYKQDCPNPAFNKMVEFSAILPGVTMLKLQLWDYNSIFSDQKIGTTKIDLQDRFFSSTWKQMPEKFIETRALYHASSRVPQGYVRLWVQVFEEGNIPQPIDISPKPPSNFEARLIIWNCKGVQSQDVEGVSDLYVRAYLDPEKDKETDTHYRAQSGKGSWNWRMKFPLQLPAQSNLLTIQLWDRDILSGNDWIGETTIPFNELAEEAFESDQRTKMKGESDSLKERLMNIQVEKFWIDMNKRNQDGDFEDVGKIQISFELLPEKRALACPVGEGREDPNVDPYLPPPVGRFEFSLNPFKMISQLCGPEFKAKICCAICCVLCLALLVFVFPNFIADIIATSLVG